MNEENVTFEYNDRLYIQKDNRVLSFVAVWIKLVDVIYNEINELWQHHNSGFLHNAEYRS